MTREQRVAIGKEVRETIDLIGEKSIEFWEEFAAEMKRRDLLQSNSDNQEAEFTDEQGEDFGIQPCPYRAFEGTAYRAVPYDYLARMVDNTKTLGKYVKWRWKKRLTS